jgi:hypothetical protein
MGRAKKELLPVCRNDRGEPTWTMPVNLPVTRMDHTMALCVHVANGTYGKVKFDVAQAMGALNLIISIRDKNETRRYDVNLRDIAKLVIDRDPEYQKTEKLK